MPDLKISQLSSLAQSLVASGDQLPIVDTSASETKKVGAADLVTAGLAFAPNASIPWAKINPTGMTIPADSVSSANIVDGSIATADIANGAVTDAKITGPIGLDKLGAQAANVVLAGPATGAAADPTFRGLVSADLPIATTSAKGAVSVSTTGGLAIDAAGDVSLPSVVTPGTNAVVTYDLRGRVTAGRALISADLPLATATTVGGVSAGDGLSVDGTGKLTPNLTAAQIPGLDASKLISGTLEVARIANNSLTNQKLADYAVSYIQEATPSSVAGAQHIGTLWFQESTARLSMWNGNSWMAVGQGSLSAENLRFCGTFDASTGLITAVTQFGTAAGLSPGASIPAATNQLTGVYLVCDTPGTYDSVAYDAGDWILCMGQARGWERIDTLSGGGGGGSTTLAGLVDVTITTPASGDVLMYNGTNWVNSTGPDPGSY